MLQQTLTAIVQQHHKLWSLIKLPRETEKTKEEEDGEEERGEKRVGSLLGLIWKENTVHSISPFVCTRSGPDQGGGGETRLHYKSVCSF